MPKRRKKRQRKLRKKLRRKKLRKEEEDSNLVFFTKNASHYYMCERRFFYSSIGSFTSESDIVSSGVISAEVDFEAGVSICVCWPPTFLFKALSNFF